MPDRPDGFFISVIEDGIDKFIIVEQTRSLYANLYVIPLGGSVAATVILVILWGLHAPVSLITWWVFACFFSFMHLLIGSRIDQDSLEPQDCIVWLRAHTLRSLFSGLTWGFLWILFVGDGISIYTFFLSILYTGYIAGSASACASYSPSFQAILIPASIPFIGRAFYAGGDTYSAIGVMVVLFVVIMYVISLAAQRQFKEACGVNFRNMVLMDQLAKQKSIAEEAANAKTRFLAAASHDLRQPFSAVNLLLGSLVDPSDATVRPRVLSKIHNSLSVLNDMLHDIMDISRLDSKSVEQKIVHVDVNDTVKQVIEQLSSEMIEKGLVLFFEPKSMIVVEADKSLFRRLLLNILDNAVKYTEQGFIRIDCCCQGDKVAISISDSGIGIPEQELDKIFGEFYQLGNPERDRQLGMGLGLAIVNRICIRMEVEIEVTSSVGEGSVFTLFFDKGESEKVEKSQVVSFSGKTVLEGLKIIVVEDNLEILDGLRLVLSDWGCQFVAEQSLEQAVSESAKYDLIPDILIIDFRLKGQSNGLSVIDQLRTEFNRHIPAILITGDTSPAQIDAANGSDALVLYKPIEPEALAAEIYSLLR